MTEHVSHPGRSAEFLSRLHDGELTAAERVHFESHRAHCAECRHAAAEFEAALSLYRSSSSAPPATDLAARILRTLQASSPRRRPFGVFFGIDLKWAAAFATALIAVIIGSSIVVRREVPRRNAASDRTIPVFMEEKKLQGNPVEKEQLPRAAADSLRASAPAPKKAPAAQAFAPAPALARDGRPPAPSSSAPDEKERQAPLAAAKPEAVSSSEVRAPESAAARPSRNAERSGGEGAVAGFVASAEAAPPRLVIVPVDGQGEAPALLPGAALELFAGERGREFILIVETGGRVQEVQTADSKKSLRRAAPPRDAVQPAKTANALLDLRFAPGDRPRRLLLRVE